MKIRSDRSADALYIQLAVSAVDTTVEAIPGLNLDLDDSGRVVGIEMLAVQHRLPSADLTKVDFEAT
ncbi:MAG: DUF2283 domain-containing protein [Telmatospirillum sp.]|nr:DUF2283 domain-containing protein [Telmatospirillum sp.]